MKKLSFFLASILLIVLIITMEGGSISAYLQISAALLITFGTLLGALMSYPASAIKLMFQLGFSPETSPELKQEYHYTSQIALAMGKLSFGWGGLGALLGVIYILSHVNTPARLGMGLAMTLVSLLYGIFYGVLLFLPLSNALRYKFEKSNL